MIPTIVSLDFEIGPWRVEAEKFLDLPGLPQVGTLIHFETVVVEVDAVEYWVGDKQYTLRAEVEEFRLIPNLLAFDDQGYPRALDDSLSGPDGFEVGISRSGSCAGEDGTAKQTTAKQVPAASRPPC